MLGLWGGYVKTLLRGGLNNLRADMFCTLFCTCQIKKELHFCNSLTFKWAHLGSNQAPTDYESVALTE